MRTTWEILHKQEEERADTQEAVHVFNREKHKWPILSPFEEPADLVDYLTGDGRNLDHKDQIYAALVQMAQGRKCSNLAQALIWLGLWPGIDHSYRRILNLSKQDPSDLATTFWECFVSIVKRSQLGRINRVASTISRNTSRDVRKTISKTWEEESRYVEMPDLDRLETPNVARRRIEISDLGIPPGLTPQQEVAYLEHIIREAVGDDADLVIGAIIYGENQRVLAEQMNISHAAAGKRVQRGLKKLKKALLEKK